MRSNESIAMPFIFTQLTGSQVEYTDQTVIHPLGFFALVLCAFAAVGTPKRFAAIPLFVILAFIPSAQRITFTGLDFSISRLIVLTLLARILVYREWQGVRLYPTDLIILAWAIWSSLAYGILLGNFGALATRSGYMIDAVGGYFLGRVYVRDFSTLRIIAATLIFISLPSVIFFLIEKSTGKNIFYIFGGVFENTLIREGRLRCQGPFSHPIMAGVFWASAFSLMFSVWQKYGKRGQFAILGIFSSFAIVVMTTSSTPAMALILSILFLTFYPLRKYTPIVWLAGVAIVAVANFTLEKGIFHLLSRVNLIGGSTGWHRYHLINEAVRHFDEWVLLGTTSTGHWGLGLQDITNQYILEGVRGGIIAMILFSSFLFTALRCVSWKLRTEPDSLQCFSVWALGVLLCVHCLNFVAVSYFGQLVTTFFLQVGMIVSLCSPRTTEEDRRIISTNELSDTFQSNESSIFETCEE